MATEELKVTLDNEGALKEIKEKPSAIIRRMATTIQGGMQTVKTGDKRLDIIAYQLGMLAAHADAVDLFLDSHSSLFLHPDGE